METIERRWMNDPPGSQQGHLAVRAAIIALVVGAALVASTVFVAAQESGGDASGFAVAPADRGISITQYTGSLDDLQAEAVDLGLTSAWATVEGRFIGYIFGAPAFVNTEFAGQFAGGFNGEGMVVSRGELGGVAPPGDDPPPASDDAGHDPASLMTVRDGVWPVGDAGEVEFAVVDGRLEFIDARASSGWTVTDIEVESDEIEVDFRRGNVEWEIEIEIEGGILEIEIDQDIEPADPGVYEVGLAGTVEFARDSNGLVLVDVTANDGWSYVIDENDRDEIEVDFRNGNVQWEFEAELDDGVIEVEIDYEIEGPFPG